MSGDSFFSIEAQFLKELYARTEPGELDIDVFAGNEASERDHVAGQIQDLHRRTHVEDENFRSFAHGGSLNDELHRFLHHHEVAAHFRMGDGDGSAGSDLFLEDGNHAAIADQDVSK